MIRKIFSLVLFLFASQLLADKSIAKEHIETFGSVEFDKNGLAHIIYKGKWVGINKKYKILYEAFNFDNGPDYLEEGLRRYVENGKMGFVNAKGKKIIPAQFDFVEQFNEGKATFCNGCQKVYHGEHYSYDKKTGVWGVVNRKGKIIVLPTKNP